MIGKLGARGLIGLALAIAGTSVAGIAQAQETSLDIPANRWTLEAGSYGCSIIRRSGGGQSPIFMLQAIPGKETPEILLLRSGTEPLPDLSGTIAVSFSPGDHREEAQASRFGDGQQAGIRIDGLSDGFLDRAARASIVRFGTFEVRIPRASPTLQVLRDCNANLLRSWGIDTRERARYTRQARVLSGSIVGGDYPPEARNAREEGTVVVSFAVDAQGGVGDCRVVASSRVPVLDGTTCRLLSTRTRYEPALDAGGNPIATREVRRVVWTLRPQG